MSLRTHLPFLAAITVSAALTASVPAFAGTINLHAMLDGSQQLPPVMTDGRGAADLTYDTDSKKLAWTVDYSGLSGPAVAAHIHGPAVIGANADVAIPFEGDLASPFKGEATLTDAQAQQLLNGQMYVNIHTAANKGGEIRGQIEKAM